jgi:hypothetical protein
VSISRVGHAACFERGFGLCDLLICSQPIDHYISSSTSTHMFQLPNLDRSIRRLGLRVLQVGVVRVDLRRRLGALFLEREQALCSCGKLEEWVHNGLVGPRLKHECWIPTRMSASSCRKRRASWCDSVGRCLCLGILGGDGGGREETTTKRKRFGRTLAQKK